MGFCLSKDQRQAVIQLLLNHVGSVGQRQAFVSNAWYGQNHLNNNVSYDGGASQFATQLVDIVQGAEDLNGILGLLDEVSTRVGPDKQKQIQQLKAEIIAYNRNCPDNNRGSSPPNYPSQPPAPQQGGGGSGNVFNIGTLNAGNANFGNQIINGDVHIDNSKNENNLNISGNNNQIGSISQGDNSESKGGIGGLFGWRKK
jgi:hypothetical protein